MCFSERVSWATLFASWVGCAVLALSGKPEWIAVAVFMAVSGSMQLWEALLWRERECTDANATLSKFGALNNHIEPLAYLVACMLLLKPVSDNIAFAAIVVTAACSVIFGKLTYDFWKRPTREQCTLDRGDGLVWQWNSMRPRWYALFLASFMLITYGYMPSGTNHVVGVAIAVSFTVSYMIYQKQGMVGSMWCYYAALMPWFFATFGQYITPS